MLHTIRPSMLEAVADCELRAAVNQWPEAFIAAGYDLRTKQLHVGAAVGTGVHAGGEHLMSEVMRLGGGTPNLDHAIEKGCAAFVEEDKVNEGLFMDDVTEDHNQAFKQINRMIKTLWVAVMHERETPVIVEKEIKCTLPYAPGFQLVGRPDFSWATRLPDVKTGKIHRQHPLQMGAYSMLVRSKGFAINTLMTMFIKRVPIGAAQPAAAFEIYNRVNSEKMAEAQIKRIARDFTQFLNDGSLFNFTMNPSSNLCKERFCKAWGTNACTAWRAKEPPKENKW